MKKKSKSYLAYQSIIDNRTADAPKKLIQCFNLTNSNWEMENQNYTQV